ncbi:hypothetical protein GE061_000879 [Apolygus lucorum]|uniref:Zinc finger PHD-type domain-containing protein n=1 Tax=Apolygus lucorum TaxID=248454 RepID=A0A6A4K9M9_APOLU|nr:hypothetical protein GE061_000879 [Apolygus lucorum]
MTDNLPNDENSKFRDNVESQSMDNLPKKPRTSEDFYLFCKFILEYENYDLTKKEEEDYETSENSTEDESGNTNQSQQKSKQSRSNESEESNSLVDISSDDSYDLVTCFCQKPFAGRPMIECSSCFTWVHLRCAKIKQSEIPDIFICPSCKKRQH